MSRRSMVPATIRHDKRTPSWFVDQCARRFAPFDVDVAAHVQNTKCRVWLGPGSPFADDALTVDWTWHLVRRGGQGPLTCWANIPYGPPGTIPKWIAHARRQRDLYGTRTLFLLPADVSTDWYQDVSRTELLEHVPFRLAFESPDGSTRDPQTGKTNGAQWPNCVVWVAPRLRQPKIA